MMSNSEEQAEYNYQEVEDQVPDLKNEPFKAKHGGFPLVLARLGQARTRRV